MLNLFRTLSSKDIVYNTDMENIYNAFSGLESQRLSLGGLTITPATNGTRFLVEKADGTDVFAVDTSSSYVDINAFTALGSGNIRIKVKQLTGTTANAEGGNTAVAHGLTGANIIGYTCKIEYATNSGHLVGDYTAGYQSKAYHDATNMNVTLHPTESENILSKSFTILVFYKE